MLPPYQSARAAWKEWEAIGASPFAIRQLRFGATLPWTTHPSSLPPKFANAYELSPADAAFADAEADRMVRLGYVREISLSEAQLQHFVSAAFVVKGALKDRLVIDYSVLVNPHLAASKFRMETLLDLAPQLRPGDSLFKFDMADGYYHVGIRPRDCKFLAFRVGRRLFFPSV